jgi:hypothetical protein
MKQETGNSGASLDLSWAYFDTLREMAVRMFQAPPFSLDIKTAELCANNVIRIIQNNRK